MGTSQSPGIPKQRELECIRACLEHQLFPSRPLPQPEPGLDWDQFLRLLARHRLSGYFYALSHSYRELWPASFIEALRNEHYGLLLYADQCSKNVSKACSILREASIEVIVLKGWAQIQSLYAGDASQRFCEDVDLLIRPRDVEIAEEALQEGGFQGAEESWPGYNRRYTNARAYIHEQPATGLNRMFSVGLHWGLWHIPAYSSSTIDIDNLFERSRPIRVAGVDVLELSPEHQVAYACAHLWLHHRKTDLLFRYYEIAAVIRREGAALDWGVVIDLATKWQVTLPLIRVMKNIEDLWSGVIPSSILKRIELLKPTWKEQFVERCNAAFRDRPTFLHLLTWLTIPGVRRRLGLIFEDIFPGPAYMQKRYGSAPGGIWPLLYFRRLARALFIQSKKLTQ